MIFIVMNYKAMKQFLTKIEIEKDCIELTYLKFNGPSKLLKIPLNELTVEYFGNGIGVSSLISNHIGIGQRGNILIRQYKTHDWTLELLKSMKEQLKEINKKL